MQTPLYDGYATIRSRGLSRSQSIRRASEIEAEAKTIATTNPPKSYSVDLPTKVERKRTVSLKSNLSQNSSCSTGSACHTPKHQQYRQQSPYTRANDECDEQPLYVSSARARPVRTPTIAADYEPLYASANQANSKTFRPLSDSSSSSSAGCRDSVNGSTGSNGLLVEYQNIKKNSRFSLDSLHSSVTPKTPDYTTAEEEQFFLYTAPASPKRTTNGTQNSERCYTPPSATNVPARNSFEMQELTNSRRPLSQSGNGGSSAEHSLAASPIKTRNSPATRHYASTPTTSFHNQRAQSLVDNNTQRPSTLLMRMQRSDSESPTYVTRASPTSTLPPQTPVRRESLYYSKPKIYATPTGLGQPNSPSSCSPPPAIEINRITYYQLPLPALSQRSSSAEILERSYTSQSLATIDQDEILTTMPTAMPVLQNPFDRRYHTLGHMRVKSMGASLHLARDSPMSSMLNMMSGGKYYGDNNGTRHYMQPHKSAGNIYSSAEAAVADLDRLAPEYMDPLDFKIGCQTTLRSKPIIPWYELAIRRDFKRQSCPPISGSGMANGNNNVNTTGWQQGNQVNILLFLLFIIFIMISIWTLRIFKV